MRSNFVSHSLCIGIIFILFACSSQSDTSIKEEGNQLVITTKDHKLKAAKESKSSNTFFVVGGDVITFPECLKYLDAKLTIIPFEDAEKLQKQYGNFLKRDNTGFKSAIKNIKSINVIGENSSVKKQIKKVLKSLAQNQHPVALISMTEISVFDLTYKQKPIRLGGGTEKNYLIDTIEIKQEDYKLQ